MNRTLKRFTLIRMKNVSKMTERFTENCQDAAEEIMKDYDIPGSELALNFGHGSIFAGLRTPNSPKELLNVCYTAFFNLFQNLNVLTRGRASFLRDECLGLVHTFHEDHVSRGYALPELSEDDMKDKLDALVEVFVNEDPLFVDMFRGNPPKPLMNAARNYELSSEIDRSLGDLQIFLANNDE